MNPPDGWGFLLSDEILLSALNSGKMLFGPHIIPKTKGLEESLELGSQPTCLYGTALY